jgi:hypothetical protein
MVRFICGNCEHKLKASPGLVGQRCKCTRCGRVMKVPSPVSDVPKEVKRVPAKGWSRLVLGVSLAAGLLVVAGLLVFLLIPRDVDQKLNDLKAGARETRRQAVVWLAESDLDGPHRARVTAALEPVLFEGDVHGELSPDLVLRAYLHWAGPDNVPAMIRMVQTSTLPDWGPKKAGQVMQALGKLQDPRAVDVLAGKLADPALRDQAVDALRLMGPTAENAVLYYVFDGDTNTRLRASQLLAEYGTKPTKIAGEALTRLESNNPSAQQGAAVWFAENPPYDSRQQAEAAKVLSGMLGDLSSKVNALALHALKLWATKDSLPGLVAFARRNEAAGACPAELIDVLARFPDESAAEAIALQLEVPTNRGRAVGALLNLGPVATKAVLPYIDDPDPAVQNAALGLCEQLKIPTSIQLDQILADVADAHKPIAHAALQTLARLRPDESSRARVSQALNAPLLDPDPMVLADALNAVHAWGSKANTATLLKLLARPQIAGTRDPRVISLLGSLQDPAAAPALAEGLTRPQEVDADVKALVTLGPGAEEAVAPYLQFSIRGARFAACWVLGEIGTSKSLPHLEEARSKYLEDGDFGQQTRFAMEQIRARK